MMVGPGITELLGKPPGARQPRPSLAVVNRKQQPLGFQQGRAVSVDSIQQLRVASRMSSQQTEPPDVVHESHRVGSIRMEMIECRQPTGNRGGRPAVKPTVL